MDKLGISDQLNFTKKCIGNNFTLKMYWKWFYNENVLEMILTIKMYWKWFYNKNVLEMIFTIKNVLEMILL